MFNNLILIFFHAEFSKSSILILTAYFNSDYSHFRYSTATFIVATIRIPSYKVGDLSFTGLKATNSYHLCLPNLLKQLKEKAFIYFLSFYCTPE